MAFPTSTQAVQVATAINTEQSQPTSVNTTGQNDTGYEGYYAGIVAITEYYTLLDNGLYEEAYQILSSSAQLHSQSQVEYVEIAKLAFETVEIDNVQPLVVWQREQGIASITPDQEDKIRFFVQIRAWGKGDMSGSVKSGDLQTQYLTLVKEDSEWKIDSFATGLVTPTSEPIASPTLDPGSVPDRSYYDSIVVIAQYYLFNNNDLHGQAYRLLSPSRPHAQSLEEYLNYYSHYIKELENIEDIKILSLRPFYEGTLQFQYITTPDPAIRRKFVAVFNYVKGGNEGAVQDDIQSRFITTIFENGAWKIYSINTSP